jgi:excisionase family DNA binding protein
MEEYISIMEAARRIGLSDKTVRRAIHDGKLSARYPHPNKAEISIQDLEAWYTSLHVRPGETQSRLTALESRLSDLEAEVKSLRQQLESSVPAAARKPPKTDEAPPAGFSYLSDFCTQHFIPYQAAADLFPRQIHGQKIKVGRRLYPIIGPKGRHDFYIQLHNRPDFQTCDDCPHDKEHGHSV